MVESAIESKMCTAFRKRGAMAIKQQNSMAGLPDRLILLPGGRVLWVELKTKDGKLRPVQESVIRRLRALGQDVRVVYGLREAMDLVEETCRDL